jgi:hypothetical protein
MPTGLALNFTGVNPIQALVFAAVFRRHHRRPAHLVIDRIAADRGTMGEARSGWLSRGTLTLIFLGMAGSIVAMAISCIKG